MSPGLAVLGSSEKGVLGNSLCSLSPCDFDVLEKVGLRSVT